MKFIVTMRERIFRDGKTRWEITNRYEEEGAKAATSRAFSCLTNHQGCSVAIMRYRPPVPLPPGVTQGDNEVHSEP